METRKEKIEKDYKARDWTNTGTCPCCFRNVKMHEGRIVLHGYNRPGHGYIIGRCFGVGYEPYERSTKGTENILEVVKSGLEGCKARLEALRSETYRESFRERKKYMRGYVDVDYGEPGWDRARKLAIEEADRDVRRHESDVRFFTEQIEAWEPGMKMPEEIAKERACS